MTRRRAPAALFLALVLLVGAVPAAWAQAIALAGTYDSAGTNPDGSKYRGVAVIEEHSGLFSVEWNITGTRFFGVGKVSGGQLIVNWGDLTPVIYDIVEGGRVLRGTWRDGQASEVLTRR